MKKTISLGVDIGGSHITAVGVDLLNNILIENSFFESPVDSLATAQEILQIWSDTINRSIDAMNEAYELSVIGIAMPGEFNYQTGVAGFKNTAKYSALYGLDISAELLKRISTDNIDIRFINDATAFAIGASKIGEIDIESNCLAIVLGTGFGTALIHQNIPIFNDKNTPLHGSFWHLTFKEGIADDYFSTRWFIKRFEELSHQKMPGAKEIADLYLTNDDAKQVFKEFGTNLTEFLDYWIKTLNIKTLIFGGQVSLALRYFQPTLIEKLKENHINIEIIQSNELVNNTLIGAAHIMEEGFWSSIKNELPTT